MLTFYFMLTLFSWDFPYLSIVYTEFLYDFCVSKRKKEIGLLKIIQVLLSQLNTAAILSFINREYGVDLSLNIGYSCWLVVILVLVILGI